MKKKEVFNPKKEDFDINQNCLIHIIQERRERFPVKHTQSERQQDRRSDHECS